MIHKHEILRRLAQSDAVQAELIPGLPLAELAGDCRVLLEHHGAVLAYSPGEIRVRMDYGQLWIQGSSLELSCMSQAQLVICGRIDRLCVERDCP